MISCHPLILNFDNSVHLTVDATVIELQQWQEKIRFASSLKDFNQLAITLKQHMPKQYGPVFLGSGDYHHVSQLLVQHCYNQVKQPFQLIILDNHPDNMRFPFGIHCGSWVKHAANLDFIKQIHVIGITSNDIAWSHAWENYFTPLLQEKVTYWSTQVNVNWSRYLGLKQAIRHFPDQQTLIEAFLDFQQKQSIATYLSIDKDVMDEAVIQTNWDQGCFSDLDVYQIIKALRSSIIASDITGDISNYQYHSHWKKLLSILDKQPEISLPQLINAQQTQNRLNHKLLELLN